MYISILTARWGPSATGAPPPAPPAGCGTSPGLKIIYTLLICMYIYIYIYIYKMLYVIIYTYIIHIIYREPQRGGAAGRAPALRKYISN